MAVEPPVVSPATLSEALALRAEGGWQPLAGGTDLMVQLEADVAAPPERVLDLSRLDELRGVIDDLLAGRGSAVLLTGAPGIGKTRLLLALLAAAGLVFLALPTLIDLADRRVRVVGDAERAMGIASAGWLVQADNDATRLLREDQTRRLASTLLRNRTRTGAQAFAFTSARVGGGATAVVRDLAAMLQHLGSRVLVVEANSLSPSMEADGVGGANRAPVPAWPRSWPRRRPGRYAGRRVRGCAAACGGARVRAPCP